MRSLGNRIMSGLPWIGVEAKAMENGGISARRRVAEKVDSLLLYMYVPSRRPLLYFIPTHLLQPRFVLHLSFLPRANLPLGDFSVPTEKE